MKKISLILLIICMVMPCFVFTYGASNEATKAADTLFELGLFSGKGTDANGKPIYDLDKAPTRAEAITMLVKLLGKYDEAVNGTWKTPFTDVPSWAQPFVGYAYENGLTSGTGATMFGSNDTTTATQYLTFVLKALGYEVGTDFQWDKAWELSDKIGLTHGEYGPSTKTFTRGNVAIISNSALNIKIAGTSKELAVYIGLKDREGSGEYLKQLNVPKEFGTAQYTVEEIKAMKGYTAKELQAAISTISDMVQYIEENDYGDDPLWRGDIQFCSKGYNWSINQTPQKALETQSPSCGAVSNLARYVLEDDYDEEGYIGWGDHFLDDGSGGGHVFNYFKSRGKYYVFDFTITLNGTPEQNRNWPIKNSLNEVTDYILSISKVQTSRKFIAIFVEKDCHRNHAPRCGIKAGTGSFCFFVNKKYQDEIDLLYFDDEFMKTTDWYEYHDFFEDIDYDEADSPIKDYEFEN